MVVTSSVEMDPNVFHDPDSPPSSLSDTVLRFWEEPLLDPLPFNPLLDLSGDGGHPSNVFEILDEIDSRKADGTAPTQNDAGSTIVPSQPPPSPHHLQVPPDLHLHGEDLSSSRDPNNMPQESPLSTYGEGSSDLYSMSSFDESDQHPFTPQSEGSWGDFPPDVPQAQQYPHFDQPQLPFNSSGKGLNEFHPAMLPPSGNPHFHLQIPAEATGKEGQEFLPVVHDPPESQIPAFPPAEGTPVFHPSMHPSHMHIAFQGLTDHQGHLHYQNMPDIGTMPGTYVGSGGNVHHGELGYSHQNLDIGSSQASWDQIQTGNEAVEGALPTGHNVFHIPGELVNVQENFNSSNQIVFSPNQAANPVSQGLIPPNNHMFYFGTIPNITHDELSTIYGYTIPPMPLECSTCEVLRRMMHTDGTVTKRIEIHGHPGLEFHAMITIHIKDEAEGSNYRQRRIELNTFADARSVLIDYLRQQATGVNVLVNDSTSDMYTQHLGEAQPLPTLESSVGNEELAQLPDVPATSGGSGRGGRRALQMRQSSNIAANFRIPKSAMALQRERTASMRLEDLHSFMHLPIAEAARRLSVCPTVLKKVCRRNGLPRWPYRKIKALDRTIATLEQSLEANKNLDRDIVMAEVHRLNLQKQAACRPRPPKRSGSSNSDDDYGRHYLPLHIY